MDKEIFDFGTWYGKIVGSSYMIPEMFQYLSDKDAIYYHLKYSRTIFGIDNESENIIQSDEKTICLFSDEFYKNFQFEISRLRNYHIVFQFSVLERFLEEYIYLILLRKPNLLRRVEQLNSDFKINSFLNYEMLEIYDSTNEIKQQMYKIASTFIVTGKIEKTFMRISNLVNKKIPNELIDFFQRLQNLRNDAVHEISIKITEDDYFQKSAILFEQLFDILEEVLIAYKIEYSKPYK